MLQLVSLNNDIRQRRLGTGKRWVYRMSSSSLALEVQGTIDLNSATVEIVSSHGFAVDVACPSHLYVSNSLTYFNSELEQISFETDGYEERIMFLENEVEQLRANLNDITRELREQRRQENV